MKLINAVFSYNRYYLLKNTVESLLEFGPEGDLLIVDDASDDPRVVNYLNDIDGRLGVVLRSEKHVRASHGGLYENMNLATQYALQKNYSHIFFIQDDLQFMWKDSEFHKRVERIFDMCPDAAQVTPLFQKGIIESTYSKRMVPNEAAGCWHIRPYGLCDLGIVRLDLVRERNWRFGKSEGENSNVWYDWGYRLYLTHAPTMAWIPWPVVRTTERHLIPERKPKNKYFLKPFSEEQITKLKGMPFSYVPIHEDFCFPWGWSCLSPYWFSRMGRWQNYKDFVVMHIRERKWPKMVRA